MTPEEIIQLEKKHVTYSEEEAEEEMERYSKKFEHDSREEIGMSDLFEREKQLQKKLYGAAWPWDIDRFILDYGMHLHMEVDEMLREVNYKLQTRKRKEIDHDLLQGEIVDVFIFSLAAATAEFKTYDEFIKAVKSKIEYNEKRNDWDANM